MSIRSNARPSGSVFTLMLAALAAGALGWTVGNPVVVSSGAKLQTEVDLPGTPNGTLRMARHYRTLRNSPDGQSAGLSWSLSFDRSFKVTMAADGSVPRQISGTMADGSYFEFSPRTDGSYVSRFDRREAIHALTADFHEWAYTSPDGQLARQAIHVDGGVDRCSTAYSTGEWTSLALGAGRMAYAGIAKVGAAVAADGAAAMTFRNGLKRVMRGPFAGSSYRIKSYEDLMATYGNDAAIQAAAGRTNAAVNAVGANLGVGGAIGAATCGCP